MDKKKERRTNHNASKRTALILFLLVYPVTVLVRYLLATKTHYYTTVLIDEHLYYSIARSIANGEGLLFMGQPANYTSILYPLLISPIYKLFPEGTNFFQLIQLFNILVMNLSLIPVYDLAKRVTKNNGIAIAVAVLSLVLPDMTLGGMILSESILYPLFFTMMLLAYRYLSEKRCLDLIWIGILGGLILFTKPGQVITAVVILLYAIIRGSIDRNRKSVLYGIAGLICSAAIYAIGFLAVRFLFHQQTGLLGVYNDQLQTQDGLHLWSFFKALILSPFCFYLMCSGLLLILPILNLRKQDSLYRDFLCIILISLAALMIGTAWAVNRPEYMYSAIHARYFAPFVSLMLIMSAADANDTTPLFKKKTKNVLQKGVMWGITLYAVLCALIFGLNAGIDRTSSVISNVSLASLRAIGSQSAAIVYSVLFAVAAAVMTLLIPLIQKKTLCRIAIGLTGLFFLVNTVSAYFYMDREMVPGFAEEAAPVREAIGDRDFIYVYATNRREYHAYLDPNTKKSVQMVYVNDLLNNTVASRGVYQPFIPAVQRGNIPLYPTADVELFAIDRDAMKQLMLSDSTSIVTKDDSTFIQVVAITKGEKWVDAALSGPVAGEVEKGQTCYISIFNEEWAKRPLTLSLELDLKEDTSFVMKFGESSYSFDLPSGKDTYRLTLDVPTSVIAFSATDCDMTVLSFSLE